MTTHPGVLNDALQTGVVLAAIAVLVVLLLRRRPAALAIAFYLAGFVVAYFAAPLLQSGLADLQRAIAAGDFGFAFSTVRFLRTFLFGALALILGILMMSRAWRASPER